jgi:hypothetical protein
VTTSTIPTPTKRKEIVRHGPYRHCASCWRTVGHTEREGASGPIAVAQAGKVAVEWVSLYMGVICIGDADEYSRFSLGDPSL